ncbi:MAG: bile acid:sodium symporter, partial [Nitriliruptoraceae bacterium]
MATHRTVELLQRRLAVFAVATGAAGLAWPATGQALTGAVPWLLAGLMAAVSATFDVGTLRAALRRPGIVALTTLLVYGPMSIVAFILATAVFGEGSAWLGLILVGVLPTDVSSPLLVWLGRGSVALATVANAVNTALAPIVVPVLFIAYTGVSLGGSLTGLIGELLVVVLVPTVAGVTLRTWRPRQVQRAEPALSIVAAAAYLALLLAVVGANADTILSDPLQMGPVVAVALVLNLSGYAIALAARRVVVRDDDRTALLFTVGTKEFSIAAVVVVSAGLAPDVALVAVAFAVVQMVTAPLVARFAVRRSRT